MDTDFGSEEEWNGYVANLGIWKGCNETLNPEGNILRSEPSVLFLYDASGPDDAKSTDTQPTVINMRLARLESQREVNRTLIKGKSISVHPIFDPNGGHFSIGMATLDWGSPLVAEYCALHRDDNGNGIARARLIAFYDAERLTKLVVFREERSKYAAGTDLKDLKAEGWSSDSFFSSGANEMTANTFCGQWRTYVTHFALEGDKMKKSNAEVATKVSMDGKELIIDGFVQRKGVVSDNGKSVMFNERPVVHRMVSLGNGISFEGPVLLPKGNEEFNISLGFFVVPNLMYWVVRNYRGRECVGFTFVREERVH